MTRPTRSTVKETYDRIGSHFAATRANPWPAVESFLGEAGPVVGSELALDLGCGNGRHSVLLAEHTERVVGIDSSRVLLERARERVAETGKNAVFESLQTDVAALALRHDSVDLAVYIAVIHHLADREARIRSLDELARVLTPDGRALVSAWSTTHDRFADEHAGTTTGFDTTVDWTLPDGETVPRYYHIYAPAEFRADLDASELGVRACFEVRGNCYGVVAAEPKRS